tara:strand:- start:1149 stop:1286 length:138 start_codon:yes stop_codon:yes gene_type:complete
MEKSKHNVIESPIFHAYRMNERAIKKAIRLLKENGFKIYKEDKES